MQMIFSFLVKQCTYFGVLLWVSVLGDFILQFKNVQSNVPLRCITDNFTHFCLGIISWLIVTSFEEKFSTQLVIQSLLCGIFASIIDVDHFLIAKSLSFKEATSLPSRPPFHNTTLMVATATFVISLTHFKQLQQFEHIGWYILVASVSHHLRDALHRGLWLWPLHSRPMNFTCYLMLSYLFPLAVGSYLKILNVGSNGVPRGKSDILIV